MIHVAIIEDDVSAQKDILNFLSRYGKEKGETFQPSTFVSAEQFLNNYKAEYDLILMDIELPGMNGMEASKRVRQLDADTTLVFITNLAQFAIGGYEVGAFDFILKPVTYANFYLKFARIMQRVNENSSSGLVVKGKQFSKRMELKHLAYIEINDHDLIFHSTDGNIKGHGSLKTLANELKKSDFVLCNQSYLVNLSFVREIGNGQVNVNGDWLAISRPKKKEFLREVDEYFKRIQS